MIVCNSGKFNFQDLIAHRPAFFAGICGRLRLKKCRPPEFKQIQLSRLRKLSLSFTYFRPKKDLCSLCPEFTRRGGWFLCLNYGHSLQTHRSSRLDLPSSRSAPSP